MVVVSSTEVVVEVIEALVIPIVALVPILRLVIVLVETVRAC